ncbi:MAG: hypothetical protein ACRDZO_00700 [Egibacteraceae bacterium]
MGAVRRGRRAARAGWVHAAAKMMLDQLTRWAFALRTARGAHPTPPDLEGQPTRAD